MFAGALAPGGLRGAPHASICTDFRDTLQPRLAEAAGAGDTHGAPPGMHSTMHRITLILAVAGWLISPAVGAEQEPAAGKLLVATEDLRGEFFVRTVVLLLRYDDTGAVGLVVNRPTRASPAELLPEDEAPADYRGTLYWGGPVEMATVRALQLTDEPPDGAVPIVDTVHQVPVDVALSVSGGDSATLRFFVGYAGWAPGQLDRELALGSWHVVPATEELVFTDDPEMIWERLTPVREYRANYGDTHNNYGNQLRGHPQYPPRSISPVKGMGTPIIRPTTAVWAGGMGTPTTRPTATFGILARRDAGILCGTLCLPHVPCKERNHAKVDSCCAVPWNGRARGGAAGRPVARRCRPRRPHDGRTRARPLPAPVRNPVILRHRA